MRGGVRLAGLFVVTGVLLIACGTGTSTPDPTPFPTDTPIPPTVTPSSLPQATVALSELELITAANADQVTKLSALRGHSGPIFMLALSPDGEVLASGSGGILERFTVRIWDVETRAGTAVLEGHEGQIVGLGFSPGGDVLASHSTDGALRLWDVERHEELAVLDTARGGWFGGAALFSPDGRLLVSGDGDGVIPLWGVD